MTGVRFDIAVSDTESNGMGSRKAGSTSNEGYAHSVRDDTTFKDGDDSPDSALQEIGRRESQKVKSLRVLLILVLFIAAVAVSATIFVLTTGAEDEEFETKFNGVAAKVLESFTEIVGERLSAVSALGASATSFALAQNMTWPFVTMNDFSYRTQGTIDLADCLLVEFLHVVSDDQRVDWEAYAATNQGWFRESLEYQGDTNEIFGERFDGQDLSSFNVPFIWQFNEESAVGLVPDPGPGPYAVTWQHAPALPSLINLNTLSYPPYQKAIANTLESGTISLGGVFRGEPGNTTSVDLTTAFYAILNSAKKGEPTRYEGEPMSFFAYPVFESHTAEDPKVVAVLGVVVNWASYFRGVVPPESNDVVLVLENACDGSFTYLVDNEKVTFLGAGDLHDTKYDEFKKSAELNSLYARDKPQHALDLDELSCPFKLHVYPTAEMEEDNKTRIPFITTFAVAMVFVFTALVFWLFNSLVEKRQQLVLNQATQSTAVVSAFLPDAVQQRLLGSTGEDGAYNSPMKRLKTFLAEGEDEGNAKPIADLFPFTTVLFADIAGFTAWSSTREPAQVFVLLQTVYQAFDALAKKHKVFKVETIGDSYVAVTGLPNEQPRHAVLMGRFAWECLEKFHELTRELEITLGPDTADLGMRFGLHSGPVTAGVLRGERPRFQLFGDTVNTAARMESTSIRNHIQVSHTTALELQKAHKAHWITRREDSVEAKGKGVMETYFLSLRKNLKEEAPRTQEMSGVKNLKSGLIPSAQESQALKHNRLIEWCVEMLVHHLRSVAARRQALFLAQTSTYSSLIYEKKEGKTCLDEVKETMAVQKYDAKAAKLIAAVDPNTVVIKDQVIQQLRDYVSIVAGAYRPNSFHNFEHACHVTMSVDKFLKRIVSPDMEKSDQKSLHEYTHGLTSDPLVLLAIVWSALIHDCDHRGVSNGQLATEEPGMAKIYHNKSIAEQNSLDVCWDLLMKHDFMDLRQAMFTDREDMLRFRQVLVNIVLATDIFDKELNDLRKQRWQKAFESNAGANNVDLRATIVMEHIIQASDVAHTMQHWHIYRKWNQRLFLEMHAAFKAGRMAKDPSTFWYQGELGFFDNYIIPLAKKLKDCNVFGVSSDECLTYAMANRREWEARGKQVVEELKEMVV